MGRVHAELTDDHLEWIGGQHVFFVATAPTGPDGHVNLSPKGYDTFRVLGPTTVAYLDLTGSGVETIAHLRDNGRLTIMFCAFEGKPRILRLFGEGDVITPDHPDHADLAGSFPDLPGARAIIRCEVERIADSCGYSIPFLAYEGERETLIEWSERRGPDGIAAYHDEKNRRSIDGLAGLPVAADGAGDLGAAGVTTAVAAQPPDDVDERSATSGVGGTARPDPVDRVEILVLVAATLVAFGIAALAMSRKEFWLDESFSYAVARLSWSELGSFALDRSGELNMSLYYAVLKLFADTGAASWWLRLPSVVPIVATTPLVWLIANRIDGRRFVRVGSVAILLTQPLLMAYAFEARAYGLLVLVTTALTLLLLVALDGSRWAAAGYVALGIVAIPLHLLVVAVVVAQLVAVVVVTDGSPARRVGRAVALTGPAIVAALVAGFALVRHQGNLRNDDPITPWSVASAAYAATGRAGPLSVLFVVTLGFAVVAIARARGRRRAGWVVVLSVAIPPVLQLVVAMLDRPVFAARYLVHLVPLICCLAAIGLAAMVGDRRARIGALAAFVVLGAVGQAVVYRDPSDETPDSASAVILEQTRPGDLIAFNSPNGQLPFQHHVDATGAAAPRPVDVIPDPAFPARNTDLEPLGAALEGIDPDASVWILLDRPERERADQLEAALSEDGFELADQVEVDEIVVQRWGRT